MSTVQLPSDEVYLVALVACRCINETMDQELMVDLCDRGVVGTCNEPISVRIETRA